MRTANEIAADFDSAPLMFKREMTRHPYRPNRRLPVAEEHRFDGKGGYAPNSEKIPLVKGIVWSAVFILSGGFFMFVGAAVGF